MLQQKINVFVLLVLFQFIISFANGAPPNRNGKSSKSDHDLVKAAAEALSETPNLKSLKESLDQLQILEQNALRVQNTMMDNIQSSKVDDNQFAQFMQTSSQHLKNVREVKEQVTQKIKNVEHMNKLEHFWQELQDGNQKDKVILSDSASEGIETLIQNYCKYQYCDEKIVDVKKNKLLYKYRPSKSKAPKRLQRSKSANHIGDGQASSSKTFFPPPQYLEPIKIKGKSTTEPLSPGDSSSVASIYTPSTTSSRTLSIG